MLRPALCVAVSVALSLGVREAVAQNAPPAPIDIDFSFSYSGQSVSGRFIGLNVDANGNATEVDPTRVLLFHVPATVGLTASPSNPFVFVPSTFERSTYFSGTLSSTVPGVYGFNVTHFQLSAPQQNLLMIDTVNDVTLVFNFGASAGPEGGVATYGIMAEEDALWPAINTSVSYGTVPPAAWANLGSGLAGTSGVPSLVGSGALTANSAGALTLTSANPSAPALVLVSFASAPTPFRGGVLLAFPPAASAVLSTDAAGSIVMPFTWPANVPPLTAVFVQTVVLDPAGPQGVSMSNAVRAVAQ